MIKIFFGYDHPIIKLAWSVYKGCGVLEDFSRAKVFLWVIGAGNKFLVPCTTENGVIKAELPRTLPVGVYSVRAMWVKDWHDKRAMSEVQKVFGVTDDPDEATPCPCGEMTIKIKSCTATFGYDGLSAYEMSVMLGKTTLSEQEWLDQINATVEELDRIKEELIEYINGYIPHVDSDTGNWFVGDDDTGVHAQGEKGDKGDDGDNGKSAYEIAVDEGYVGTEEEWLASLKGDKGDKGDPGTGIEDKDYDPENFSGLGKVYLQKNIVTIGGVEKNILTQSAFYKDGTQIPNTDTVFVVQYDFDLNGQTITMPANSVLEFSGGSINNGTLVGQKTVINAPFKKIFGSTLSVSGTWDIDAAYPEWFGPESAVYTDIPGENGKVSVEGEDWSSAIERCFAIGRTVVLSLKDYWINNTITVRGMRSVCGIASTEFAPSITMPKSGANGGQLIFDIKGSGFNAKNIIFIGCYSYDNLNNINYQDEKNPNGFKFAIPNSEGNVDAVFENCTFFKLDVAVESYGRNITFTDCLFSHCISRCVDIWHHRDAEVDASNNTDTRGYIFKGCRFHTSANYRQNYNGSWRYFNDHVCIRTVKEAVETIIDNCYFDMGSGAVYLGSKHRTSIKNCTMSRLLCFNAIELLEDVVNVQNSETVLDKGYPWVSEIANNTILGENRSSWRAILINGRFDGIIQNNRIENWLFQGIKIQGDRAGCSQAIISGNKFYEICDGAYIRLDPESYHGEYLELFMSETKYCVEVLGYFDASFTNNVIRSSRGYDCYIAGLYSYFFGAAILNGNAIENVSSGHIFISLQNENINVVTVDGNFINRRPYNCGNPAQRPNIKNVGFVYYDTSNGRPLCWSGNIGIGDDGWIKFDFNPYVAQDNETLLETITLDFIGFYNNRYWWRTSGSVYSINSLMQKNKKYRIVFTPCFDNDLGDLLSYLIGRDGIREGSYGDLIERNGDVFVTNNFTSEATGINLSIMTATFEEEDSEISERLSGSIVTVKVFEIQE